MLIQRTTLKLDQEIYKQAKKKAIDEEINFQQLVNKALENYLRKKRANQNGKEEIKFSSLNIGGLKTGLRRKDIYNELLNKKSGN